MAIPKNFWIPPALGYTPASRGLTEAQLDAIEELNGFSLPMAYRSLMLQQNGGRLRYSILHQLSVEDFCSLSELDRDFVTFRDHIAFTCTEDDIATLNRLFEFCNLNRLIIFAVNGHEVGCFDYGWRSEAAVINPQLVFLGDDGEDILHFKILKTIESFDDFLGQITLPYEVARKTYLGIKSSLDFDSLCAYLAENWQTQFEQKNDDFYGWFDFEKWYCGTVPFFLDDQTLKIYAEETNTTFQEVLDWVCSNGRTRMISAILSPNRHRSGTYLYPDNPELTLVLKIGKPWFPIDRAVEQLCTQLMTLQNISTVQTLP
jgi:SMI1 / KNR4 family (SUKH-1)